MKSAAYIIALLSVLSLTQALNCKSCLTSQEKCDLKCACENDHSVCASSCCSNDICSEAHQCESLIKPGFIALIVIAVILLIVILLCVLAACTGVCSWILCCWRDKFREKKYLPKKRSAIQDDLSITALGYSEEEEEAFEEFPFKGEQGKMEYSMEKDFDFADFERNEGNRSTKATVRHSSDQSSHQFEFH